MKHAEAMSDNLNPSRGDAVLPNRMALPRLIAAFFAGLMALAATYYFYVSYHVRSQEWVFATFEKIATTQNQSMTLLLNAERYVEASIRAEEGDGQIDPRAPTLAELEADIRAFRGQWSRLARAFTTGEGGEPPPRFWLDQLVLPFLSPAAGPELHSVWHDAEDAMPITDMLKAQTTLCAQICIKPNMSIEERRDLVARLRDLVVENLYPRLEQLRFQSQERYKMSAGHTRRATVVGIVALSVVALALLLIVFMPRARRYAAAQVAVMDQKEWLEGEVDARTSELAEALTKARVSSEAKSEFLRLVSHEVRTPMNGILGGAALLEISKVDAEQVQCVNMIKNSATRMMRYLEDVIEMSALASGEVDFVPEPTDLADLIAELIGDYEKRDASRLPSVTFTMDRRERQNVMVDPQRIRQVVAAMLSEAVSGTEFGTVAVKLVQATTADGVIAVELTVSDGNPGALIGDLNTVFSRFRSSASEIDDHGSGLGLAIAKAIVEAMGGTVTASSEREQGTMTSLSLPLRPAPGRPSAPARQYADDDNADHQDDLLSGLAYSRPDLPAGAYARASASILRAN
ncbi:MAG: ATP-binding protein [Pseudomonadota bacterium]